MFNTMVKKMCSSMNTKQKIGLADNYMLHFLQGMRQEDIETLCYRLLPKMIHYIGPDQGVDLVKKMTPFMIQECLNILDDDKKKEIIEFSKQTIDHIEKEHFEH